MIRENLEAIAKDLEEKLKHQEEKARPLSVLEQEIVLVSEHLDEIRQVHQEQLRHLIRAECYVETDLMKLDFYNPRQYQILFKARDNLKNKLLQIDKERRQLVTTHTREVRELHDKLFSLLAQHTITK